MIEVPRGRGGEERGPALREEDRRIRALRLAFDLTQAAILQDPRLTMEEAREMEDRLERLALVLFPGKERAFNLIYRPRLRRAMRERFGAAAAEGEEAG
jgi:hypothetical protein